MERFQQELSEGRRKLMTADHLVSVTFPLVKDNKLLLTAAANLFSAAKNLMASLLHYDEAFKRIPHFREEYDSMLYWLRARCMPYYGLSRDYGVAVDDLRILLDEHKSSSVEFSRKDGLVICSDSYKVRKITVTQLKSYVEVLKRMLLDVEGVVSRYEGVFGRGSGRAKAR
ncbi:hypothetical protein HYU40_00730 [Candidatus Woesearchaeota archaeon]|nr:hypothetical protein [Candidatus Woesearchaeota archaeon]